MAVSDRHEQLLRRAYVAFNAPTRVKTIVTVHNIAFQGRFDWSIFNDLRIDYRAAQEGAIEYFGGRPTAWASKGCCRRGPTC